MTEDSASMVCESLTAGAATGLLPVPRRTSSRLTRGVDRLVADGLVRPFSAWRGGVRLEPSEQPLDESARCPRGIKERWLTAV